MVPPHFLALSVSRRVDAVAVSADQTSGGRSDARDVGPHATTTPYIGQPSDATTLLACKRACPRNLWADVSDLLYHSPGQCRVLPKRLWGKHSHVGILRNGELRRDRAHQARSQRRDAGGVARWLQAR